MDSQIVLAQPISQCRLRCIEAEKNRDLAKSHMPNPKLHAIQTSTTENNRIPQLPLAETNEAIVQTPIRTPKPRKLRSAVWNDMTKQQIGDGRYFAVCNHCQKKLPGNSSTGTTHLLKHLKFCQEFKNSKKRKTSKRRKTQVGTLEKKTQDGTFSEPRRRKLRSMVWKEMTREYRGDGSGYFAVCNHCKKKISCSNESGTTHLMNHLRVCPIYQNSTDIVPKVDKIVPKVSLPKKAEDKIVRPLPRNRKLRSEVWKNMTREERGDGSYFAVCNHCKKKLLGNNRRGTTQFLNHLRFCDSYRKVKGFAFSVNQSNGSDRFEFDQDRSRKAFACMMILHDYPFSIVDHAGLIKFLTSLQPRFQMMTRDDVRADCIRVYEEERKKLQEVLLKGRSKVNLAVSQCSDYLCLTCHFVGDDWRLRKRILSFAKIGSRSVVLRVVEVAASDWLIWNKVGSLLLEEYSYEREIASEGPVIFECWAHTLDVLIEDSLKVNAVNDLVERARGSMIGVDSSLTWQSTLQMLETALGETLTELSDVDRVNVQDIVDFLSLSRAVKSNLSSWSNKPAINYLFRDLCYLCVKFKERRNGPGLIKPMAEKMFEQLAGRLIRASPVLIIGSILDPRFKMKPVDFFLDQICQGNRSEMMKTIQGAFLKMYNEYEERCNEITARPEKSDVDFYLEDDVIISDDGFDVLAWWMQHAGKFPVLSMMARDILSIPVSTGELTLKNMGVDFDRRWVDPEMAEIFLCAKDWLRGEMEEVLGDEIGDGFSSIFSVAYRNGDEDGGLE